MSVAQISDFAQVNKEVVKEVLRENGVRPNESRRLPINEEQKNALRVLYKKGTLAPNAALEIGTNITAVRKFYDLFRVEEIRDRRAQKKTITVTPTRVFPALRGKKWRWIG